LIELITCDDFWSDKHESGVILMKYVDFEEYQTEKSKILSDDNYIELATECECGCGQPMKMYTSRINGTFYEIDDDGVIEFWTNKHPSSRFYKSI